MQNEKFQVGELERWLQRGDRQTDWLITLGLLMAAIVLFTINLGELPLRDWDEGLVAQVAREIWQAPFDSLTWLHPTLWGEPYFNKPSLIHSLIAVMYSLSGVNEWTTRLPSALLTAVSVPLMYGVAREIFYPRPPAVFAALVYLTCLPVARHGRLAMLDGAILCFLLLLLWCLLRTRRDYRYALGVGIGFGLICLTKGIMVGVLLGTIAAVFIGWDTPRLLRSPHLWLGVGLGSVPVALWYVAQWQHYGQTFLDKNLVDQSLQRIWQDVEANGGPPWYYLLEILKYSAPWLLFLPLGLKVAWSNRNLSWAKLAIVWSSAYLVIISAMVTKLPWYVLPIYPALALIAGAVLAELWQKGQQTGTHPAASAGYSIAWAGWFSLLGLAGWAGVVYFGWIISPAEPDIELIMAVMGMTMTVATVLVVRQNPQFLAVLIWGMYVALLLLMGSNHWVWELAETYPVKPVAAIVRQHVPATQNVLTSYPHNRPSLNFYSERLVVPASGDLLKQRWTQQERPPFFLLDDAALNTIELPAKQVLGTAEGWSLITRTQPANTAIEQ
jgi:4-amino-4-deoxy-L-arabinose transferase-like glycosyltransferase